jgi:hypothetical protein
VSALNVSSASRSGSLKIIRSEQLSHVTVEATEHTMLGNNRMTRNEFGDDIRIRIEIKTSAEKITSLRKKVFPLYPWYLGTRSIMYGAKSRYCLKPKLIT